MNASDSSPPGRPVYRRGHIDKTRPSKESLFRSLVSDPPAVSCFSSKARLFASAAGGVAKSTTDPPTESTYRSRVKVWEAANDEVSQGGLAEQQARAAEVEWSRQFLGHSITAVLFAPTPQTSTPEVSRVPPVAGYRTSCDDSSGSCEDEEDHTILLIGTDKGMVAAADVSGRCGSKLLYAVYMGEAHARGEGDASMPSVNSADSTSGERESSSATNVLAAAAGVRTSSAVYGLRALPGRSDAVLALVGCSEGSTVYLLNVKDGSVLQEDALSKAYTLMATPSRLCFSADVAEDTLHADSQQVALLGCGNAKRVNRDADLEQPSNNGVLFLFDVPQRKQWLKLTGASSDSCCSLALQDKLEYAAACFHSSIRQQQTQLLVWQLPSRARRLYVKGAAARRKKLPPAAVTQFFEGIVQLLLPVTALSTERELQGAGSTERYPGQLLIGLSRSSIVALWGCYSTVAGDTSTASFSLELLLRIDSAASPCGLGSTVSAKEFSTQTGVAAAARAPGVWYIEEGLSYCKTEETLASVSCKARAWQSEREGTSEPLTAHRPQELTLHIVRGSYAVPVFGSVILPSCFDSDCRNQQLYLPLLSSSTDKLSRSVHNVIRPLSAKEIRQRGGKHLNHEEANAGSERFVDHDGNFIADAAPELPPVCLKRKIGIAGGSEDKAVTEASRPKGEQTKSRKAPGLCADEKEGHAGVEKSSVASILRQALVSADSRLLEFVLSSTSKDKKEVAASVASLTPPRALVLLQHLVHQQQNSPATSILKGPWIEELVKQHGVVLGTTEAGREQLVLLLLQVEERRRAEAALVKVKGRVELLLQQMQRIQKLREQRRKDEVEAREPLVVHREHGRS